MVEVHFGLPTPEFLRDTFKTFATSEIAADRLLVDLIKAEMDRVLHNARVLGRYGWYDPEVCTKDQLVERALKNIEKGEWIDAINLLAMVYARQLFHLEKEDKTNG